MLESWNFLGSMLYPHVFIQEMRALVLFGKKTNSGDTYVLGFEFPASDRVRNFLARPRLVICISGRRRPIVSSLKECIFASIPAEAIHLSRDNLPQPEICTVDRIMSLRGLAIHPKIMCFVIFRVLSKVLRLSEEQGSHKKFLNLVLLETASGKLPELPQEVLMDIFALLEIPDLLRAGSVCSSWHTASTGLCSLGQYKGNQTPCLLYTSESAGENIACLYSLAENRTYRITLPEPPIQRRYLLGSSDGWLVTVDEMSEMHIVNPVTGEQFALPPVITVNRVMPIFDDTGAVCMYQYTGYKEEVKEFDLDVLRNYLHRKAFVFYDESAGRYIVVLIHHPYQQLSFARVGDHNWTLLAPHLNFEDCTYKDGLLYAVTIPGKIFAFDLNASVMTAKVIMDSTRSFLCGRIYIVHAPWGDLLQIWKPGQVNIYDEDASNKILVTCTGRVQIYKVDTATETLVRINSLGGHVLFIGNDQSLCLRADEYPQLLANHVYFTDDSDALAMKCRLGYRLDIGVLDLDNRRLGEIVSPHPWSKTRAPVWLIPNPRKMNPSFHS